MIVAPSVLSADFGNLKESIAKVNTTEWLHVDVMDGHFVPNMSLGPVVVKGLRKVTNQILDTHLMITNPMEYAADYVNAGSDRITFHVETVDNPIEVIYAIKKLSVPVGISLKPNTSIADIMDYLPLVDQVLVMSVEPGFGGQAFKESALIKIKELSVLRSALGLNFLIVVDGGINDVTGKLCIEKGADVLVAGSYVFNSENPQARIDSLKQ